jgi:hypothetical protein
MGHEKIYHENCPGGQLHPFYKEAVCLFVCLFVSCVLFCRIGILDLPKYGDQPHHPLGIEPWREPCTSRHALRWSCNVETYGAEVIKLWVIYGWKFCKNLNYDLNENYIKILGSEGVTFALSKSIKCYNLCFNSIKTHSKCSHNLIS